MNMALNTAMLSDTLAAALADVAQRVQRSLVVVHNGRHGAGAGVVWRSDGHIITNHHVVARGRIAVTLPDGRDLPARLVADEPEIDLALLKVEASELPAALVADARSLCVGQVVLAVGHPWGQRGVVTAGIISGLSRAATRGQRGSVPILRSDVTLAPGNSGGPLVNAAGGVVGINTMLVGGDLGVAIPSHVVSDFVAQALGEQVGVLA